MFGHPRHPIVYISLVSYGLEELCALEVVINTRFLAVLGLVGVTARSLVSTVISFSTPFEQSQ